MKTGRGEPWPLGASLAGGGVNFAIFSSGAEGVDLCLFEGNAERRIRVRYRTGDVWHVHVSGVGAGQAYGYRVHGRWDPAAGSRFNAHKLLLDPYARALTGPMTVHPAQYDYRAVDGGIRMSRRDSAHNLPKCVVVDVATAPAVLHPRVRATERLVCEMHVKGLTAGHAGVEAAERGCFRGVMSDAVITHLKGIGVTSVELLPVQEFVDEPFLTERGLRNYWGYNTCAFFLPSARYAQADPAGEFRQMVARLHEAGIEVILDVVYNHTAEGDHRGPTFSFRGIDNAAYYCLERGDPGRYVNDSGCGNTLRVSHPAVLQLVLDSLRYWVSQMGVDGFRFDLATGLGRGPTGFDPGAAFFQALSQDPVLQRVHLIAEPWDLGPGGYRLGGFPHGFSEWNDQYRDTVRRFWRGDEGILPDFARQLHGASDLFEAGGRPPQAGVHYVACHDGFTTADVVSFESKHNEANGEANRDGHNANYSFNCGVEGATDDAEILALRDKQQRNLLATVFVSQGTPMLLAGDEFGHSQGGNNNAYCQDNAVTWLDWRAAEEDRGRALTQFVADLAHLRQQWRELRAGRFVHGLQYLPRDGLDEIAWYHPGGVRMQDQHWHEGGLRTLGLMLNGEAIFVGEPGPHRLILAVFNAATEAVSFVLPAVPRAGRWHCHLTTARDTSSAGRSYTSSEPCPVEDRSISLFRFEATAGGTLTHA